MNKQELIKAVIELPVDCSDSRPKIDKLTTLELIKLLKEAEKVTIPQLIAEKIKYCKETDGYSLFHAMDYCYNFKECADWLERNGEVFARAWLDGYEIQGRKYVVTDGNHLYFKNYQEDIEIVILVDEQPGTMEYVKKFNTKEEAQKAADILGWKVQEVDD